MNGIRGNMLAGLFVAMLAATGASQASDSKGQMPSRLSMNVTTAKQTQGASFGEKVASGLHAAGNSVVQGDGALTIECGRDACVLAFADGVGYRADLSTMSLQSLAPEQVAQVRKAPADAALIGPALPAGGIVSAAVSSVGGMAKPGGAVSSSYAAGRVQQGDAGDVPLADGDYQITLLVERAKVVEKATSGLKDTLKTNVRMAAPSRVQIVIGFGVENGVLKTRHDTARNSISNVR